MSLRQMLPAAALPLIDGMEWLVRPWMKSLGSAMTLDLVRI